MSTQIINHTYRLKRGQQKAVERVNPLLDAGEPIVVFCEDGKTRLKIGDGTHYYNELEFIGGADKEEVLTYPTRYDFPTPPNSEHINAIFKATNEAKLWQWNQAKYKYEPLDNVDVEITLDDIEIISGGEASELLGSQNK